MTNPRMDEPLGMAVHSLPNPSDMGAGQAVLTGRWKLIAIMLVCSLPVLAAYFTYFVIRPQSRTALGELIDPIRPVGAYQGESLDGATVALATLKGQWLLVSIGQGHCEQDCQQRLFLQRQLRETLGKDRDRLDRIWLIVDRAPVSPEVRSSVQGATVLRVTPEDANQWMPVPAGKTQADFLFVVDPMGNTMMRFPSHFDGAMATKARRDLDRLLRASIAWDPPGR